MPGQTMLGKQARSVKSAGVDADHREVLSDVLGMHVSTIRARQKDQTVRSRDRYGKRNQTRCATATLMKRAPEAFHESGN